MKTTELKTPSLSYDRIIVTPKFINDNKLSLIDTASIKRLISNNNDFFGFGNDVYIDFLPLEDAKEFLTKDYLSKIESGEVKYSVCDLNEAVQDFLDYMVFAWGKAEDERGLSASRSIEKLSAWLNILNRPDLSELISDDDLYNPYGAPALIAVCEKMGIAVPNSLMEFSGHKC